MLSTVEFFGILIPTLALLGSLFAWQSKKIKTTTENNALIENSIKLLNTNYKTLNDGIKELNESIKESNRTSKEFTIAIVKFEMQIQTLFENHEKTDKKFSEIWSQIHELKK